MRGANPLKSSIKRLLLAASIGIHARRWVNADIGIAVTTQGIGFAGETTVLDSDAVLTLGIQFAGQQLGFQRLDDGREGCFQLVDSLLFPFPYK